MYLRKRRKVKFFRVNQKLKQRKLPSMTVKLVRLQIYLHQPIQNHQSRQNISFNTVTRMFEHTHRYRHTIKCFLVKIHVNAFENKKPAKAQLEMDST